MAYDTVVDKAQLESAVTASANAIRAKTGGTSAIMWDINKGFADAISQIETGGNSNVETHEITFASDIVGNSQLTTILSGNQFIKKHYAETTFFALLVAKNSVKQGAYNTLGIYHGNKQLSDGVGSSHGFVSFLNANGTTIANAGLNGAINGTTWNLGFRADSAGNLKLQTPANRNVAAGTFLLYLGCGV